MIILYFYIITTLLSLLVLFFNIYLKILTWNWQEKIGIIFVSILPILNFTTIFYGGSNILNYRKNRENIMKEDALKNRNDAFKLLDKIDIKHIESYLRKKKLKKLK